jgi:hypothetical protein
MPTNKKQFIPAEKGTGSFINVKVSLATNEGEVDLRSFGDDAEIKATIRIEAKWLVDLIAEYGEEAFIAALSFVPTSIKLEGKEAQKTSREERIRKLFG